MNTGIMIPIARIAPKFIIPIFQDRKTTVTNPALLPVSPSYYDRRFPAAAKADAGKTHTPLIIIWGSFSRASNKKNNLEKINQNY